MTSRLVICKHIRRTVYFSLPVIAVRVSGGHLCEAEAPNEPAGETAVRCVAIRFPSPSSLRSRVNGCGNPFSLKGYTDSFTLRVHNDKPFGDLQIHRVCSILLLTCHCGAGVRWTPLRSRSTDRAGRRDRCKACGNPFSISLVIAKPCKRLRQSVSLLKGIRILSCFAFRMTSRLVICKYIRRAE